jgi:hypothetical protein
VGEEACEDNRQAGKSQQHESELIVGRPGASGAIAETRRNAPEAGEGDGHFGNAFENAHRFPNPAALYL